MTFLQDVSIVICQLLAALNIADRFDPDPLILDHSVAIGVAGMVDEPGFVSIHCSVDDHVIVDGKEKGVVSLSVFIIVLRICFVRGHALSDVFN